MQYLRHCCLCGHELLPTYNRYAINYRFAEGPSRTLRDTKYGKDL